jgi:endonuclease YncB( thermonuclease family)
MMVHGCGAWLALALSVLAPALAHSAARVLDGLAIVQADGSLRVSGETVYLYGVYLPRLERTCTTFVRPPRCGAPSVLVLNDLIEGFVRCQVVRQGRDAVQGICTQAGRDLFGPREDIAATLVQRGWALAAENAPPEYRALEALAKSREVGLWGPKVLNLR